VDGKHLIQIPPAWCARGVINAWHNVNDVDFDVSNLANHGDHNNTMDQSERETKKHETCAKGGKRAS